MDNVKTAGGWVVLLTLGYAVYWVGNQRKNKNRRVVATKPTAKTPEPRKEKETKAKKTKKEDTKQQSKPAPAPKAEEKASSSPADDKDDDEVDNREFARQLQNAKSGTVISGKAQNTNNRTKSVKQTRAQEKPVVESSDNASAPSSTTGGDADNDESPAGSPELAATPMGTATNGDVSDMLEKTTSGPQVMKITSPTNSASAKKVKTAKPAEVQETKKQRQNRQKAEANRIAREAEEKERKVLEEKQRRVAREAEGRAAKDGSAFMASKAPASSVWTAPSNETEAAPSSKSDLLDTFEPAKTNGSVKPKESSTKLADEYNGFSEEEQMRRINEESEDHWETVTKAQRKKKNPAKENADSAEEKQADKDFSAPKLIKPTGPGQSWSQKVVHVEPETRKVVEREMEIQDSEWEVA